MKKITILKVFLTFLFIVVLFLKVNFFEVVDILLSLDTVYLAGAFFLVPTLYVIRTIRWNMFLRFFGIPRQFMESFRVIIIGVFYGLVTPGKVGELGRAYHIPEKKVLTLPTIIMEKLVDISTLVILSFFTILIWFPGDELMLVIVVICVVLLILGMFLLGNHRIIFSVMKFFRIENEDCGQFAKNFRDLLCSYRLMGTSFLLSFLYYLICYAIGYLVILSAGFLPISVITMPIIILMGNIPLTISGLGIRESIGSLAFVYLGESAANGFVFAFLLFIIITVIPGIFGYILTMREK